VARNRTKSTLSGLFAWALERDIVPANPVVGIRELKEAPRERVLDDDELRKLWAAGGVLGYPDGPFLRMLLLAAARRNEIARLEWSELDLAAGVWRLPAHRAKTGAAREIPLTEHAVATLLAVPRIGERFVFTTNGRVPICDYTRIKGRIDAASRVTDWTLHDLRRSAATTMADKLAIMPHVVSAVLGHAAGDRIHRTYNKSKYLLEQRNALDRWATHITGAAEPRVVVPLHAGARR
jgi:integrase